MKWLDSRSGAGFVQHELRTAFHPKKKGRGERAKRADVQGSQTAVAGRAAPTLSGRWLERQVFRPHPRPTEKSGGGPSDLILRGFLVTLRPTGLKGAGDITVRYKT